MRNLIFLSILFSFQFSIGQNLKTRYELTKAKETSTYEEVIGFWKKLDQTSKKIKLYEKGKTDSGYPLHLAIISNTEEFDISKIKQQKKSIILIQNGIHPGEPDGIDASMLLARDIAEGKVKLPDQVILAIIPVYNIGGFLKKSPNYRVDQNGPTDKSPRGNAQNFDLNRDYIKLDSKNARSFVQIFHELDPDVFIDNHVSNGADYQHIMTFISSQHSKVGGEMGDYMNQVFEPGMYRLMKEKNYNLIPYVNVWGKAPDEGWNEFFDSPRYSSGYGTLWSTFSFVPETHMLKPYNQRVEATYQLMLSFIDFVNTNRTDIQNIRKQSRERELTAKEFPVRWKHNPDKFQNFLYTGYKAAYKKSEISGLDRLYYDRNQPFEKEVPVYNVYETEKTVTKPLAYIIPQGWWKVIELLQLNGIQMHQLEQDMNLEVEIYKIKDYKPAATAYEAHHINSNVSLEKQIQTVAFRKGDWYIPMNQTANRFLIEVLEPESVDSYFAWNFFDGILQQKEGFSPYVFEDIAAEYLKNHPEIRKELEEKQKADPEFAKDAYAQLNFVYEHSPWIEPEFMQYPVYRILK